MLNWTGEGQVYILNYLYLLLFFSVFCLIRFLFKLLLFLSASQPLSLVLKTKKNTGRELTAPETGHHDLIQISLLIFLLNYFFIFYFPHCSNFHINLLQIFLIKIWSNFEWVHSKVFYFYFFCFIQRKWKILNISDVFFFLCVLVIIFFLPARINCECEINIKKKRIQSSA